MTWAESWQLAMCLADDPSSRVGAALAGWAHPADRGAMVTMDVFDLLAKVNSSKGNPDPYPRPWDEKHKPPKQVLSQARIRAALRPGGLRD